MEGKRLAIVNGDTKKLFLGTNDNFCKEYLSRLIGLAQELTNTWTASPMMCALFFLYLNEVAHFGNGKLVGKEFLVLGTVKFIMRPLFERDISADKENEPADLLMLFLNDSKEIEYNVGHSNDFPFVGVLVWQLTLYTKIGGHCFFICKK